MLSKINWPTAFVVGIGTAAVWAGVYFKFDPAHIGGVATAFLLAAGEFKKLGLFSGAAS